MKKATIALFAATLAMLCTAIAPAFANNNWVSAGTKPFAVNAMSYNTDGKELITVMEITSSYEYIVSSFNIASDIEKQIYTFGSSAFRPALASKAQAIAFNWHDKDSIAIWSLAENKMQSYISGHGRNVIRAAFANGDSTLVTVTNSKTDWSISRWNAFNGTPMYSSKITPLYKFSSSPTNPTLSADGETLWMTTGDAATKRRYIEMWRTSNGEHLVYELPTALSVLDVNGTSYVCQASNTALLTVRNIFTNAVIASFQETSSGVAQFAGGGKYLVVRSMDGKLMPYASYRIKVFNIADQRLVCSHPYIRMEIDDYLTHRGYGMMAFTADMSAVAIAYGWANWCPIDIYKTHSAIGLYNLTNGSATGSIPTGNIARTTSIAVSPGETYVATSGMDRQTIVRQRVNGSKVGVITGVGALAFSPDGKKLILASDVDSALKEYALPSLALVRQVATTIGDIAEMQWSPDGTRLLCRSASGVAIYNYADMSAGASFRPAARVAAAGWVPQGNFITALVLDTARPTELSIATVSAADGSANTSVVASTTGSWSRLLLSPDASLFTAYTTKASVHRTSDGSILRILPGIATAFLPDKPYVLSTASSTVGGGNGPYYFTSVFKALSIDGSSEDFFFGMYNSGRSAVVQPVFTPSGKALLYMSTDPTNCEEPELWYRPLDNNVDLIRAEPYKLAAVSLATGTISTKEIVLQPYSPLPVVIHSITLSDTSLARYVSVDSETLPDTLENYYRTRKVSVKFSPLYAGPMSFSLVVVCRGYGLEDTLLIPITADVVGPLVALSEPAVDFGEVPVGERVKKTITIRSTNNARLFVSSIAIDDADHSNRAGYALPRALPILVGTDTYLPIEVSYLPAQADSLRADLVLETNNPDQLQMRIPLRGRGISVVSVAAPRTAHGVSIAPNPLSSVARIRCTTTLPGPLSVQLFATDGRLVATVLNIQSLDAGTHDEPFSVENISAGVYFCRITTHAGTTVQPVVVSP